MRKVAQSLGEQAEAFLLSKRVSGCTEETLLTYRCRLRRFTADGEAISNLQSHA